MTLQHVMLCYFGPADHDWVLHEASELCAQTGARISMILPVVDAAMPEGCCGIQGSQWRRLMDEESRESMQRAVHILGRLGCPPVDVAVEVGASFPEIADRAAARCGCDAVAVGRKRRFWSTGGFSRRQLRELRQSHPRPVFELGSPSTAAVAS